MKKDPKLTKAQLTLKLESMENEINRLQNEIVKLDGEKYEVERRAKAEGYQEAIREVMQLIREGVGKALIVSDKELKTYPTKKWEDIFK